MPAPLGMRHLPTWVWSPFDNIAKSAGLVPHQLLFISFQLLSYPLGFAFSRFPSSFTKHVFAITAGLFYGYTVFGLDFVHCLILPTLSYLLMIVFPEHPVVVTVTSLAYLSYHFLHSMFYDYLGYRFDFTMSLMIIAVKTSIVACSYSDGIKVRNGIKITHDDKVNQVLISRALHSFPKILEYASYMMFFGGLITGPSFLYNHYLESMDIANKPSNVKPALTQLLKALGCLIGFVGFGFIPPEFTTTEQFLTLTYIQRFAYIYATLCLYRWQFHFGFYLAEGACIAGGVGYDKELKNWTAVNNVNILQVELGRSATSITNSWNKSINDWLKNYIFFRVDVDPKIAKYFGGKRMFAMIVTRVVSAFWHGFYPGYYFFFLGALFTNIADDVIIRLQSLLQIEKKLFLFRCWFDWMYWFFTQVTVAAYGIGFIFLDLRLIWKASMSIYFGGHLLALLVIMFGFLLPTTNHDKKIVKLAPKND